MKISKFKICSALTIAIFSLFISGCKFNKYLPPFLRQPDGSDIELEDTFELDEIQIEVKIPEEIEEADYFFTLEINRDGTVLDDALSYSQSDEIEVVVYPELRQIL